MGKLLEIAGLTTRLQTRQGPVYAVNGVSLSIHPGETVGLVGESGCGKTVTVRSLLGLIRPPAGQVLAGRAVFENRDLLAISDEALRQVRGARIGVTFQDPMASLNPVLTVGHQIAEVMQTHLGLPRQEARARAAELLQLVSIPDAAKRLNDYPHQFSGGMRQRVLIAMALACKPQLWIADEPTTALDVTVQAQLLDLVRQLRAQLGMAILWITHDLGVIAGIADRVAVMYAGFIVEEAAVDEFFSHPLHPYSQALLNCLPRPDADADDRLTNIPGAPPNLQTLPTGCPFVVRCPHAFGRCHTERPMLEAVSPAHTVACWWNADTDQPR